MNIGDKQILKNKCNFATNKSNSEAFRQKEQNKQRLLSSSLAHHNSFHVLPSMQQAIYIITLALDKASEAYRDSSHTCKMIRPHLFSAYVPYCLPLHNTGEWSPSGGGYRAVVNGHDLER